MQKFAFKFLVVAGFSCLLSAQAASIATIVKQESRVWVQQDDTKTELSPGINLTAGNHIVTSKTGKVELEIGTDTILNINVDSEVVLQGETGVQSNVSDNKPGLQILYGNACLKNKIPAYSTGDLIINIGSSIFAVLSPMGHICVKREFSYWSIKLLSGNTRVTYLNGSNTIGLSQAGTELQIDDFGSHELLFVGIDKLLKPKGKSAPKAASVVSLKNTKPVEEVTTEPKIEVIADPSKEAITEPEIEVIAYPSKEAITEPEKEVIAYPSKEAITEPEIEVIADLSKETITEPEKEISIDIATETSAPESTSVQVESVANVTDTAVAKTQVEARVAPETVSPESAPGDVRSTEAQEIQLNDHQIVDIKLKLERAEKKYYAGNPYQAIAMLRPIASSGDAEAQFMLGNILYSLSNSEKFEITEDPVDWYKMAAAQDHPQANYALGAIYQNKWVTFDNRSDLEMAISYYEIAKKLEHPSAKSSLSKLRSMAKFSKKPKSITYTNTGF